MEKYRHHHRQIRRNGSSSSDSSSPSDDDATGGHGDDDKEDEDKKNRKNEKKARRKRRRRARKAKERQEREEILQKMENELTKLHQQQDQRVQAELEKMLSSMDNPMTRIFAKALGNEGSQSAVLRTKPVDFPRFNGDVLLYASFKETFNRLADDCGLKTSQRHAQLRVQLDPAVLRVIANIENVPGNYDAVWQVLDERFYNPRMIYNKIIWQLTSAPETVSGKSETFTELLDRISTFEINVQHFGVDIDTLTGLIVANLIGDKLSGECRTRLTDSMKDKKSMITLHDMKQFLRSEAMVWLSAMDRIV